MSEIEKMKRYIERTKLKPEQIDAYPLRMPEAFALVHQTSEGTNQTFAAIILAFHYGQAKGYRMAKAEVRA